MKKGYLILLVLAMILPSTTAIGLSPTSIFINYEPGVTKTFNFFIVNNLGVDMDASLYTDGEYATFITFKEPVVRVAPWQNKEVAASITFPSTLLEPGPHHVKIGAVENPANRVTQGIAPRVGIEMKIKFDIPYPGKYARFQLDIPYINTGEKLPVTLTTKSLGKETINTIQGTITISNDEKIQSILPVIINSVQSEEEKSYHQVLTTENLLPGDYHAQASLTYDGIYGEANTDFRIGSRYVNVTNYTKTFEQGKIGEMIIAIAGKLNNNINYIFSTIYFFFKLYD